MYLIISLFLALCVPVFSLSIAVPNNDIIKPDKLRELYAKVTKEGHVRLVIGLQIPRPGFKPEGYLSPADIERQRESISASRKELLKSMSGYDVKVYRVYKSLPYVAMKVDEEALQKLINSPWVTSIQEDSALQSHEINNSSNQEKEQMVFPNQSIETD